MAQIAQSAVPAVRDTPGDGLQRLMELARHALPVDRRRLERTIEIIVRSRQARLQAR
jgi:hypothetical protein